MSLKLFPHIISESAYSNHNPYHHNSSAFIKTKQEEIIRELQKEIEKLRNENSDLKFSLCIPREVLKNYKSKDDELPRLQHQNDSWSPKIGSSSIKLIEVGSGSNIKECKGLDNELEAARKMIEDLNWVKVHNESKIHNQELKIQELQREIKVLKSTELELVQLQIPGIVSSRCSMASPPRSSGRRSSSLNRRGSTQSVLPNNYKESVATLPPISKHPT